MVHDCSTLTSSLYPCCQTVRVHTTLTFALREIAEHLAQKSVVRLLVKAQTATVLQVLCKLLRKAAAQRLDIGC